MNTTSNRHRDVAHLVTEIREARFIDGLKCPRCGSTRIQRWGTFSGRRRYRCRDCVRTFSDLTGTPVAWSKCLSRLPDYRDCMRRSATIRASARAVGMHITTSFRWRHRLLRGMQSEPANWLTGIVEAAETRVICTDTRRSSSYPRRSVVHPWERPSWILCLRDRRGRSIIGYIGENRPNSWWADWFVWFVQPPAVVVSRYPTRASTLAIHARRTGLEVVCEGTGRPTGAAGMLFHAENARALLTRFRRWLDRFCGVSTRYLDNYISWFEMLEPTRRTSWRLDHAFSWPIRTREDPDSSQQSPRTPADERRRENIGPPPTASDPDPPVPIQA